MTTRRILLVLLTAGLLAAPRSALACAVCWGQSDSPLAQATNMGIFFMLGVTVFVLASFATFFVYLARRKRLFADDAANAVPAQETV